MKRITSFFIFSLVILMTQVCMAASSYYCHQVDNLEDGDFNTLDGNPWTTSYVGSAWVSSPLLRSGANGTANSIGVSVIDPSTDDSSYFVVKAPLTASGTVDISSGFQGVAFWAYCGQATTLRVALESAATSSIADAFHNEVVLPPSTWQAVTVLKGDFTQTTSTTTIESALSQMTGIVWQSTYINVNMYLGLDEVCVLNDQPGSTPTPTRTATPLPTFSPQPSLVSTPEIGDTHLCPSPARGTKVKVVYRMERPGKAKVRIFNAIGDLMARAEEMKETGLQETALNIAGYAPGVYLYKVEVEYTSGGKASFTAKKFVVIR